MKDYYPFNKIQFLLTILISEKTISLKEYFILYDEYKKRNPNLHLYNMTSKTFGIWAEEHIKNSFLEDFQEPKNQYHDLIYEGLKIEIKSSRANTIKNKKSFIGERALSKDDKNESFDMNFQQLKLNESDFFIFVMVWKDNIDYYLFSSNELKNNKYYSDKQHKGNVGEGQMHIKTSNLKDFEKFKIKLENLILKIKEKIR